MEQFDKCSTCGERHEYANTRYCVEVRCGEAQTCDKPSPPFSLWVYDPRIDVFEEFNVEGETLDDHKAEGEKMTKGRTGWKYEVRSYTVV